MLQSVRPGAIKVLLEHVAADPENMNMSKPVENPTFLVRDVGER